MPKRVYASSTSSFAAARLREILVAGEGEDYVDESEFPELAKDLEEAIKDFLAVAQADIGG